MTEIWRDIKGYEGLYQVSSIGRVKSLERKKQNHSKLQIVTEKIKQPHQQFGKYKNEYLVVNLYKNNKGKNMFVHRLVAEAFLDNFNKELEVNHKDGNKQNNCIENLEMLTRSENQKHAYEVLGKKRNKALLGIVGYNNKTSKPVRQYDMQGNFIKEYGSAKQASIETSICYASIKKARCGEQKQAGGYVWKYE